MRPVKDINSTLKTPLNEIIEYQANVRLLRCLVKSRHPMSYSELAERTGLSLPGVHKVVSRMMQTGIIHYIGSGRQQQVALRKGHRMAEMIIELFNAEEANFDSLLNKLKEEIETLEIKPKSAWIFGKVAQGVDDYGDAVQLALLGNVKTIDKQIDQLRTRLYEFNFEVDFDVTLDLHGLTIADVEARPAILERIILLWGIGPSSFINGSHNNSSSRKTHHGFDRQSMVDARAWSKLLKTYPEIIERTIKYLNNRIPEINSGERQELLEWRNILKSMSYQRLKKFLESDSERSVRLRQSLPFWQVLNGKEREKLEGFKSHEVLSNE